MLRCCITLSNIAEVKKENLHRPFKSRFFSKQLWHPVIKKSPVLSNFGSWYFILLSKNNNWLVLRGYAKTVETFTVLGSSAWLLITLPTECCDNFDNAPQILIPLFSLVVLPNSNSHVTVWIHNPSQNTTSARTATLTQIINHENFLTCLFFS